MTEYRFYTPQYLQSIRFIFLFVAMVVVTFAILGVFAFWRGDMLRGCLRLIFSVVPILLLVYGFKGRKKQVIRLDESQFEYVDDRGNTFRAALEEIVELETQVVDGARAYTLAFRDGYKVKFDDTVEESRSLYKRLEPYAEANCKL